MRDFKGYEIVQVSASIDENKLKKAVRSGKISFAADQLKGKKELLIHPLCAKLIKKAQAKSRGVVSMPIAASDILYDMEMHGAKSIWAWMDTMKTKKAYNWIWEEAS